MYRSVLAIVVALASVALFGCTRAAEPVTSPPQASVPSSPATPAVETPSAEQPASEPSEPTQPSRPATVAPKPKSGASGEAAMRDQAGAAALKAAKANAAESVGTLSIDRVTVAQDHTGKWWGMARVKPSNPNVDELTVLLEGTATGWKAFDMGTEVGPQDGRFPAEVRSRLG